MNRPIRVFRVEHSSTKVGPFYGGSAAGLVFPNHKPPAELHPAADSLLWSGYICSWGSRERMLTFIDEVSGILAREGYVVAEFEVVEYLKLSDGQVIFNRSSATMIEQVFPTEFLKAAYA